MLGFILQSAGLGLGLAMDAFSVSLADGLHENHMKMGKMCLIAGIFAIFQALMPLLGWVCVHTMVDHFAVLSKLVPWIALLLLGYIGVHMILESRCTEEKCDIPNLTLGMLLTQGVATSIDALSVSFTIAEYELLDALLCVGIIAIVTFVVCLAGVALGKRFGMKFAGKASVFGGVILIAIGVEIFLSHMF
ncbi:MAG: manganese efflux pump [Oscillospiraceae bacterium]|nr:manganese efflux pump [Oscillospiraceae bacterium]